jgi:XTP/dITP diphosphohydrolase
VNAVLVSGNLGKLRELRDLLPDWSIEALGTDGLGEETGETFSENARAKARWGRRRAPRDAWVLGEDSGLEVRGMGGDPGIRSARLAGPRATDQENLAQLLRMLEGVEGEGRRARYVCELVILSPEGEETRGRGTLEGRIAREPRGTAGFGYDPAFVPAGETETIGVLGQEWKREHSHRARAVRDLIEQLQKDADRSNQVC